MKILILFCAFFFLVNCQTVTISENQYHQGLNPRYEDTKWFFLWGLVPNVKDVSLHQACNGRSVAQMQTQDTFLDQLIRALTLGLVYPRTAKVWCK